jgi:hypothetical protein
MIDSARYSNGNGSKRAKPCWHESRVCSVAAIHCAAPISIRENWVQVYGRRGEYGELSVRILYRSFILS